jgi:circadian clock protein KaiC
MRGGFTPDGLYLIEGDPGSGKTTLALQFMLDGVKRGERCLYVTLSEDEKELRAGAASHGWSLDGIDIFEIRPSEDSLRQDARYTMYHPSEVELAETTKACWPKRRASSPGGWSSTRCRSSGCWRRPRCATGGRFSR